MVGDMFARFAGVEDRFSPIREGDHAPWDVPDTKLLYQLPLVGFQFAFCTRIRQMPCMTGVSAFVLPNTKN